MTIVDMLFGNAVLITGVEDQPEGWLKVFVGPRWKNVYCVCADPVDQERVKSAWGAGGHVTMAKPEPHQLFNDENPYDPA